MKTKKPKKEENNPSAFSHLIEQVEKEKKKARIMYSVGIVVLALSLFSFLLFSPFEVPAFSQLGDRILGREEIQEEEQEKEVVKEEVEEETPEETPEETEETGEETGEETQTPTPTPAPVTTSTPTPVVEVPEDSAPATTSIDETLLNNCKTTCENNFTNSMDYQCQPAYDASMNTCAGEYILLTEVLEDDYLEEESRCFRIYLLANPPSQEGYDNCVDICDITYYQLLAIYDDNLSQCESEALSSWTSCKETAVEELSLCYTECEGKY